MKRQLGGHAIPGVPEQADSWTATGDMQTLDLAGIARAVITALIGEPLWLASTI